MMKRTNYSEIAQKYDQNQVRRRIGRDDFLFDLARSAERKPVSVLDVACGTGNYLEAQTAIFTSEEACFHGIDLSEAMLSIAREKVPRASLRIGNVEDLPYDPGSFDYVVTSFAFHHFVDKARALDEMGRALRPGGSFRMRNIAPALMPSFWVYKLFPETVALDEQRFWSQARIFEELSLRGFVPVLRAEYSLSYIPWREILEDAQRRDISELAILGTEPYEAGLAEIRRRMESDPEGGMMSEMAVLECTATKR